MTEVGGALRDYLVDGRPLLDGYGPDEMCTGARGQSLIPWPNRIRAGNYEWEGQRLQLDLSEPEKGGAIHGLTRWRNWELIEHREDTISFGYTLHACQGWPWVLDCRLDYYLGDKGLSVRTTAVNRSPEPCPYGTGAHPYLRLGSEVIDYGLVQVPDAHTCRWTRPASLPATRRWTARTTCARFSSSEAVTSTLPTPTCSAGRTDGRG